MPLSYLRRSQHAGVAVIVVYSTAEEAAVWLWQPGYVVLLLPLPQCPYLHHISQGRPGKAGQEASTTNSVKNFMVEKLC